MSTAVAGDVDARFGQGLLTLADAGRYLRVPRQTLQRWARGYEHQQPLLHVLPHTPDTLPMTFVALAEAHVLDALRDAGVQPRDVLWDFAMSNAGQGLIAGDTGQHVLREIVEDQMSYIAWDDQGYPTQLQLRQWLPAKVTVNVRQSFGQPIFAGSGVRVADVAGMTKAGESAETVADEFGISIGDVRAATRILLGRAS
jgi:uncharacterized protein (DUF433 family)